MVWRLNGRVIDTSYDSPRPGLTTNTLTLPELQREHLFAALSCDAFNSNLTSPSSRDLRIDMNREYRRCNHYYCQVFHILFSYVQVHFIQSYM